MSHRMSLLIGALIVLLLGLAVLGFLSNHELKEEEIFVGYSGEARRNDYLAAQRLLEAFDVSVKHHASLAEVDLRPGGGETLFLAHQGRRLADDRLERLLNWVHEGGHLITAASPTSVPDPVADRFDIQRLAVEEEDRPDADTADNVDSTAAPDSLSIDWPDAPVLRATNAVVLDQYRDGRGVRVLRLAHGDGSITLSASTRIFSNRRMGYGDHADLFWQLINAHGPAQTVLIVGGTDMPFIFSLIWAALPETIVALALLALLWLFGRSQRFGPMSPSPSRARRRIIEHIVAGARYRWRQGSAAELVLRMREETLERLARSRPDLARQASDERNATIAKRLAIPVQQVADCLDGDINFKRSSRAAMSAERFTQIIKNLKAIQGL